MATQQPTITDLEPHQIDLHPDHDVGGVALEIVDRSGSGFRTIPDQAPALDLACKITAAIARLRAKPATP
jgi:hypothetical protein